jgi:hypothetical protein
MLRVFHIVCSMHVTTRGTYVTYRQLPHALAATVASVTFTVPPPFWRPLQYYGCLSLHLSRHHRLTGFRR